MGEIIKSTYLESIIPEVNRNAFYLLYIEERGTELILHSRRGRIGQKGYLIKHDIENNGLLVKEYRRLLRLRLAHGYKIINNQQ